MRPPHVVSLIRFGEYGTPIEAVIQDSGFANANGLEFRSSEDLWIFNLSTRGLESGIYHITIQVPDGRFRSGFILRCIDKPEPA